MKTNPEAHEKLSRMCAEANPGTAKERWDAACLTGKVEALLASGSTVTLLVGKPKGSRGELHVLSDVQ